MLMNSPTKSQKVLKAHSYFRKSYRGCGGDRGLFGSAIPNGVKEHLQHIPCSHKILFTCHLPGKNHYLVSNRIKLRCVIRTLSNLLSTFFAKMNVYDENFSVNSKQLKTVNYLRIKALSQMF